MVGTRVSHATDNTDWVDNDRIVFWDSYVKQTILWNAATGGAKSLPGIEGPATFGFSAQGRQAIINRTAEKSDIWLLSLEK